MNEFALFVYCVFTGVAFGIFVFGLAAWIGGRRRIKELRASLAADAKSKILGCVIVLAVSVTQAQTPPQLPPAPTKDFQGSRLLPDKLPETRATLRPPMPPPCTNNCPVAPVGYLVTWPYEGPGYPYQWFEFYERVNLTNRGRLLGSNSVPQFALRFTNGPMLMIEAVVKDLDMEYDSSGRRK